MPLISVSYGATLKLGDPLSPTGNYAKFNFEIRDIDTSIDVKQQLSESMDAIKIAFEKLEEKLDAEVDKLAV